MAATRQASNPRATTTRRSQQQQPSGDQLAVLAALFMSGASAATISNALLLLLPSSLRASQGGLSAGQAGQDAAQKACLPARQAARLVLGVGSPAVHLRALSAAYEREEALYRAFYAANAARRLAEAKKAGTYDQVLATEQRYLAQHIAQSRQRAAAYGQADAAVQRWGLVVGWKHGHPKEPRPSHLRADGHNFNVLAIPRSTGALPGVLPGCTCGVVAPYPGARMLT